MGILLSRLEKNRKKRDIKEHFRHLRNHLFHLARARDDLSSATNINRIQFIKTEILQLEQLYQDKKTAAEQLAFELGPKWVARLQQVVATIEKDVVKTTTL